MFIEINGKLVNSSSIVLDGVDKADYPDFCDAYVEYAEFADGQPLTEIELIMIEDNYPELVNELAVESTWN
jgi:hypothetical protein